MQAIQADPIAPIVGRVSLAPATLEDLDDLFDAPKDGHGNHLQNFSMKASFLVAKDRRVLGTNKAAKNLLAGSADISVLDGRLSIYSSSVSRELSNMVESNALSADNEVEFGNVLGIPCRRGTTRYFVKVLNWVHVTFAPTALVVITDLYAPAAISVKVLSKIFKFSEREAELAALFGSGYPLEDCARQMNISPNTARVHLGSIYKKSGCQGQTCLARMLARIY